MGERTMAMRRFRMRSRWACFLWFQRAYSESYRRHVLM